MIDQIQPPQKSKPSTITQSSDVLPHAALGRDKGKQRESNEDSLGSATIRKGEVTIEIYAVADGMGGHDSGETASQLAVHTVMQTLTENLQGKESRQDYLDLLCRAVFEANRVVRDQAAKMDSKMGTTLVAAVIVGANAYIASVGDSRAYVISPSNIRQITHDQSFVQSLLDMGAITLEQAKDHPYQNILTQAIGSSEKIDVGTFYEQLGTEELLLLCTDGLWKALGSEKIHQLLQQTRTPNEGCAALVNAANAAGGEDNISAILIRPTAES